MAPEIRSEIIQILEYSRREFNDAADVAEAQAQLSPEAGRWSVLQCVEHVTTVEERFLVRLEQARREGAPPVNPRKETDLLATVMSRITRAQAPEPVRPVGRFASLADALQAFNAARTRTIRFTEEHADDLYSRALEHARFGPMNGAEFVRLMAGHAQRHAAQIREVRDALASRA